MKVRSPAIGKQIAEDSGCERGRQSVNKRNLAQHCRLRGAREAAKAVVALRETTNNGLGWNRESDKACCEHSESQQKYLTRAMTHPRLARSLVRLHAQLASLALDVIPKLSS